MAYPKTRQNGDTVRIALHAAALPVVCEL
jgi:hypothetical protein